MPHIAKNSSVESTVLSDGELALLMADTAIDTEDEGEKADLTVPILVSVLVALASVAVAVFLIMKFRKKAGEEDTKE